MQRHALMAAMMAAGLLAACGGGGGGADPATPPVDNTPSTTTTISLSGVAAKGLMNKALVTAHKVNADGSVDTAVLAGPVETGPTGAYSLSVPTTKGEPYVIKVTATADTTHRDEVTGADEPLPAGFTMRSVQVAPSTETATVTTSVTPFSEMTAKAAETATGGFTKANAEQAKLAVTQLLGFDPASVSVKAADASGASDDEKKLALMLTAVAQMASTGALGCSGGDNGSKTKCVVETLAKAAKTNSVKLEDSSSGETKDVSGALATAVNTVANDDRLNKGVPASVLTTVVANLGCSGDSCNAATSGGSGTGGTTPTGPTVLQLAIVEAKLWFGQLAADWNAMFKPGGADTTTAGTVNLEANKFRTAMTGVQVPAEALAKSMGAIASCIDLFNDFKAGRASGPNRNGAFDQTSNDGSADFSTFSATGCSLFQDSAATTVATAPENANFIGISTNYFVTRSFGPDGATTTRWRHAFTLTPVAGTPGAFSWVTRARRTTQTCLNGVCGAQSNVTLQTLADGTVRPSFTGNITSSTNANGSITAFTMKGQLAASFVSGGNTLANDHLDVDVSGTRSLSADGPQSATLEGKVVAFKADGSVDGTLTIKSGSMTQQAYAFDSNFNRVRPGSAAAVNGPAGSDVATLSLNLAYANAGAEFEGLFSATDPVWDKSDSNFVPTKLQIKGALRTLEAGVAKEFLNGTFLIETTGFANFIDNFDMFPAEGNNLTEFVPRTLSGPDNFYTVSASFVGQVTAPGRPLLELKVSASQRDYSDEVENVSMQYSAIVNGTPRTVVNFSTGTPDAEGNRSVTLTELSSGLKVFRAGTPGNVVGSLSKGDLALGTLNTSTGRVDFVDNSFISLAVGL